MINTLQVCEGCDAEFVIGHNMCNDHYIIKYCPFCGEEIESDMEDRIDDEHFTRKYDS